MLHFIGVDLAWAEKAKPNESGVVMLDQTGTVVRAGWVVGIEEVLDWLDRHAPADALLFVDAPLVGNNARRGSSATHRHFVPQAKRTISHMR